MKPLNDDDFSFYSLDEEDQERSESSTDSSCDLHGTYPLIRGLNRNTFYFVREESSSEVSDGESSDMELDTTSYKPFISSEWSRTGEPPSEDQMRLIYPTLFLPQFNFTGVSTPKPKCDTPLEYSMDIVTQRLAFHDNTFEELYGTDINLLEAAIDALYCTFYATFEHANPTLPPPSDAFRRGYVLSIFKHFDTNSYTAKNRCADVSLMLRYFLLADFMRGLRRITAMTTQALLDYITFFEPDAREQLITKILFPQTAKSLENLNRVRGVFYLVSRGTWINSVFSRASPNMQPTTYFLQWLLSPESPLSHADIFHKMGSPKQWAIPNNLGPEAMVIVREQNALIERTLKRASKITFNGIPHETTCLGIIEDANALIKQHCPTGVYTPAVIAWAKNSLNALIACKTMTDLEAVLISSPYSSELNYYIRDRYDRKLFKLVFGAILRRFDRAAGLPDLYGDV